MVTALPFTVKVPAVIGFAKPALASTSPETSFEELNGLAAMVVPSIAASLASWVMLKV